MQNSKFDRPGSRVGGGPGGRAALFFFRAARRDASDEEAGGGVGEARGSSGFSAAASVDSLAAVSPLSVYDIVVASG